MATQSIITQVNRCGELVPSTPPSNPPKVPKKLRTASFFGPFLCCFRSQKNVIANRSSNSCSISCALLQNDLVTDKVIVEREIEERPLLEPVKPGNESKKCMVIDLDETLVHSSFVPVQNADFIIPVDIDGTVHQVYVLKRPHVDEFLERMGQLFECILFTASLGKYADPVTDLLDKSGSFQARLFRESCVYYQGNYVKDLSRLGRDLENVIILDNSPSSYMFHQKNAVPILSWFDDPNDTKLLELIPFFEQLADSPSAYEYLNRVNSLEEPFGKQAQTIDDNGEETRARPT